MPTEPGVKHCIDAYYEGFVRKFNPQDLVDEWLARGRRRKADDGLLPPEIKGGKHGTMFKKMVATWGEARVLALIQRFFTTTDPQITRGDYSVEWFYSKAQYMLTSSSRLDSVTAHNVDAANRAMED